MNTNNSRADALMRCPILVDEGCLYGPYGMNGETVCKFCGFAKDAARPVEQHEATLADAHATAWKTGTPPVKDNDYEQFIVAVRREHDPRRIFVFAAHYANNYKDELRDRDGNEFVADGWYDLGHDTTGEFNDLFMPTLGPDDKVIGWQDLPKWSATASTQPGPTVTNEPVEWIGHHRNGWEALNETRKAVAEIIGAAPETWPDHGNAPLAIAAAIALRQSDSCAKLTDAARDVLAERARQITQENWTPEWDDKYRDHELSCAAGCYAMYTLAYPAGDPPPAWPWAADWWKPTTHRRNLVKAGALILASIERLDRAGEPQ